MSLIRYNVPVVYALQDNFTYASKRTYKIKECEPIAQPPLWCNIKCNNDDDYCNPYIKGEKIYAQHKFDNSSSFNNVIANVFDHTTGLPIFIPGLLTTELGIDAAASIFLNIIVDTDLLPDDVKCWHYEIGLFTCQPDPVILAACIANKESLGETTEQATYNCWVELCGPGFSKIVSEPYCELTCDVPTILIEGTYPKYDCEGKFYGDFTPSPFTGTTNSYRALIRVYGEVYKSSVTIEETVTDGDRISAKKNDGYKMLVEKVPPYVAEQIAICFAAEKVYIDGVAYKRTNTLAKNFDEGKMWIINTDMLIDCDNNKFTCK